MYKSALIAALFFGQSGFVYANCTTIGNDANLNTICTDGNSYISSTVGNVTTIRGWNGNTGRTWNQTTIELDDLYRISGYDSDGHNWNLDIYHNDNTTIFSGTDSNGDRVYKTCTEHECD